MVKKKELHSASTTKITLDLEIPISLYEKFRNKAEIKEIASVEIGLSEYFSHRLVNPDYSRYGITLARAEVDALIELELFSKKPFHLFGGPHFNGAGVYIKQTHVKELHIHRHLKANDDHSPQNLPSCIGNFGEMEVLDVSNDLINKIPASIGNCRNLRVLALNDNQIESIPNEITNLQSIELLDISHNSFSQLPWVLGFLDSLKKVFLHKNPWNSEAQTIINEYISSKDINVFKSKCRLVKSDWHPENISPEDFMEF